MTRVVCIGEAMIELSMAGTTAGVGVAGDTLNTAIYLKRMAPNLDVDYVTLLGDDPFSDRIEEAIAAEDINTQTIGRLPGARPGLYAITTDDAGERSFTYWRSASAARQLFSTGDFNTLETADYVYLSGISLAILPESVRRALLETLTGLPARLVFDSNFRPALWETKAAAQSVMAAFWAASDIALPSIDDEMALFDETEAAVTARWQAATCEGALKRGPEGPMSIGTPVEQAYQAAPKVVDTTAAGDSFNGGYLAAKLTGATQAEALTAGHTLAATVVQHRGAILPRA